jgi:predicted ATPase
MYLNNPNLFVISGGPGSGKTTVLRELAKLGVKYAPEVAREIIQQQLRTNGTALPWGDRRAYTQLMLKRSIESYLAHTPASEPMFSDRGIPDTLCYARLIGLAEEGSIRSACHRCRYAPIGATSVMPPLPLSQDAARSGLIAPAGSRRSYSSAAPHR